MLQQRGIAEWLLRHLPAAVAATPERVLINLSCALIGLSVLIGTRSPALNRLYPFPLYEWALTMLVGGLAVLAGMASRRRTLERLGMILISVGCVFYAVLLLVVFGWAGAVTAFIFLAIAAAKAIRLLTSGAARSAAIRLGEQMKETPPSDGGP